MAKATIERDGSLMVVRFPYNPRTIERIKALAPKTRWWDGKRRAWIVSATAFEQLEKALEGLELEFEPRDLRAQLEAELHPGLNMVCFICGTRINCDACSYREACPVKWAVPVCVCEEHMARRNVFSEYVREMHTRLGGVSRS